MPKSPMQCQIKTYRFTLCCEWQCAYENFSGIWFFHFSEKSF